jgi:hypothetical protein
MVLGPLPLAYGNRTMTKKFAFLIVAAMSLAAPAYAQSVRVISGDIEHIYGPGGQLLDDDALRARNERAGRDIQVKRIERDTALRQEEAEAEYERQRALADQADPSGGYEQVQGAGSTGLLVGGPARVGHFSTRPRTQSRIGSSRPIHH